jgi:hypothetical protein
VIVKTPGIVFFSEIAYVAGSTVLDIYSQGDTEKEAIEMAKEAISLTLECLGEDGTLDEHLRSCGLKRRKGKNDTIHWTAPAGDIVIPKEFLEDGPITFEVVTLAVSCEVPVEQAVAV